MTALDEQVLMDFATSIEGEVLMAGEEGFERAIGDAVWWSRSFGRSPAVLVRVADENDVVLTLELAREQRMKVSVLSGGHSPMGSSLSDGTILLDVSELDAIQVDRAARVARVGPGVHGGELQEALSGVGLSFPTGHQPSVAMGGYLLGGGVGLNAVGWGGTACFNVRAVEVVTAAGERLVASEHEHSDIWWAARGAGAGAFFVVTCFHIDLFPTPGAMTSQTFLFDAEDLPAVGQMFDEVGPAIADEVELIASIDQVADEHGDFVTRVAVTAIAFVDSVGDALAALSGLADHPLCARAVWSNEPTPTSIAEFYAASDPSIASRRHGCDSVFTDDLGSAAAKLAERLPDTTSQVGIAMLWRGAESTEPGAFTSHGRFLIDFYHFWDQEDEDDVHMIWRTETFDHLREGATSVYLNEFDGEHRPWVTPSGFSDAAWDRLAELRETHDPGRVFAMLPGWDSTV